MPPSFIHDLLNRVNIVDAIDRHVSLKKAGANYVACCPFHNEKTPSFTVSPTKQFYHCFGCGAHGNAINFLMEYSGYSFVEAVQHLAASTGISMPDLQPAQKKGIRPASTQLDKTAAHTIQDIYEVMRIATRFYREQLKQSNSAISYLKQRRLTGETAARFAIGYAPEGWQNLAAIFPEYNTEKTRNILIRAGLMIAGDSGKYYDRFRDRIIFPILNQQGQIVAFGGRTVNHGEPKYLNSPETDIFIKGHEIYNLFSARKAIRNAKCVIVVEGYMDVVALSQHGIDYAVATLGTAVTDFHIQKLLRYSDRIIFCFDGDNAGKKAARRALENSLAQLSDGKTVQFLFLPENEDPDSFIHRYGKNAFEQQISQSIPLSEFLLTVYSQELNLRRDEDRAKFIHDMKPLLQSISAPALSIMLLNRIAQMCDMNIQELESLMEIRRKITRSPQKNMHRKQPISPYRRLLLILLQQPGYFSRLDQKLILCNNDNNEELSALKVLIEVLNKNPEIVSNAPTTSLLNYLQETSFETLLRKIESETLEWNDDLNLDAEFSGTLQNIADIQRKKRMTELHSKPLNSLTEEEKRELQRLAMH
ncbi:MAG: DNA primase [Burkholderiales bacterium]|nr:DNA primase [Burkholderiales bacterium]